MICPKCGNKIVENADFCPFCGANLKQIMEQLQSQNQQNIEPVINQNFDNKKPNQIKRNILIIIGLLIIVLVGIIFIVRIIKSKLNNNDSYGSESNTEIVSIVRDENGAVKFIDGTFTDIKVKSESDAYKALDTLKDELKFNNVEDEFYIESVETSKNITYYRFHQKYKDVEVYSTNLIVSVDENGKVLSMSGYYVPNIEINVNSKKTKEELEKIVKDELGNNNVEIVESNKYIYADNQYTNLVYIIDAYSNEEIKEYIVDANTGDIIDSSEITEYVSYEFYGKGIDGNVNVTIDEYYDIGTLKTRYRLIDSDRNIEIADASLIGTDFAGVLLTGVFSSWTPMIGDIDGINFKYLNGEGKNKELAEIGISSLKNMEEIYDYYYNVLGRKSYDNKGGKIVVNIGMRDKTFGKEQLQNAIWLGLTKQMFIGYWNGISFAKSKDVLAHEFTHGVISKTVKFAGTPRKTDSEKAFETGALNEGIADILGSLIEGKNWTMNEDIEVLRSLSNPSISNNPSVKGGEYYYPDGYLNENKTLEQFLKEKNLTSVSDYDDGGEHQNATVPGHAAYLMYNNGAFSSMEQMAKVWYNALFLMSSYSNFEDCALAVIKSAKNQGLSDSSIKIIEEAFMETKMLEDKRIEIKGNVSSGEAKLSDVKVVLKAKNSKNTSYTFATDADGNFKEKIQTGTYEITFIKDKFEEYKKTITIRGDTTINVELASKEKQKENKNVLKCKSENCHTLTIYFLEDLDNTGLKENYETYSVDDGTIMGTDVLINTINNTFGGDFIKTDGETFKMTVSGFTIDFAWYYRGTNTKFDFNKPITKDIEIEMKLFDGAMDNNFFQDIYDILGS